MRQVSIFQGCAQDCRVMASKERDLQFKSMLLALAAQIDALANARKAFLKLHPASVDTQPGERCGSGCIQSASRS